MSRPLYMYTNGQPEGDVRDYLDWVLSDEGQCILIQRQYAPVRKRNLRRIISVADLCARPDPTSFSERVRRNPSV